MKRFSEYIIESSIKEVEDIILLENFDEMVVEGSFLKRLANWIGGTSGEIVKQIKDYSNDLTNFGKNVKTAFNGYVANLQADETVPKDKQQEIVKKITGAKPEDAIQNVVDITKQNDADLAKSPSMAYLYLYALELAKEKGDTEAQKALQDAFDKIPKDVKKQASETMTKEVTAKKEETAAGEGGEQTQETPTETPEPEQKTEKEVNNITETDPIDTLSNKANIDNKKLQSAIYKIMLNKDGEVKWDNLDNANDVMTGLSAIICGGMLIKNETVYNSILNACGIKFGKDFIASITKKTE